MNMIRRSLMRIMGNLTSRRSLVLCRMHCEIRRRHLFSLPLLGFAVLRKRGKREVKLNPEELQALENRRKRMQSAATSMDKKASGSSSGSERRRRSEDLVTVPIAGELNIRKRGRPGRSEEVGPPPVC